MQAKACGGISANTTMAAEHQGLVKADLRVSKVLRWQQCNLKLGRGPNVILIV